MRHTVFQTWSYFPESVAEFILNQSQNSGAWVTDLMEHAGLGLHPGTPRWMKKMEEG